MAALWYRCINLAKRRINLITSQREGEPRACILYTSVIYSALCACVYVCTRLLHLCPSEREQSFCLLCVGIWVSACVCKRVSSLYTRFTRDRAVLSLASLYRVFCWLIKWRGERRAVVLIRGEFHLWAWLCFMALAMREVWLVDNECLLYFLFFRFDKIINNSLGIYMLKCTVCGTYICNAFII